MASKSKPNNIDRAIDAGIRACDLYDVAKQDIIRREHLRLFLQAALEELQRSEGTK